MAPRGPRLDSYPRNTKERTTPMRMPRIIATLAAVALAATGCGGSAGAAGPGGSGSTLKIAYFQGAVARADAVIAANPDLAEAVQATIELHPIDSGVAGIAQLRAGAFPVISGVGNPPFVGAIANGTEVTAVYVESLEQGGLVVNDTINTNEDLIGKKVGVLVGSTLDFQLRGWLKANGLEGRVQPAGFASEAAATAAWKAGKIDAVYISQAFLLELQKHGGRVVATAEEIADLGYAAVVLLAVATPYVKRHPDIVQQLVCQTAKAQALVSGPQAHRYITRAADYLGVKPEDAIAATKDYPFIPDDEQLSWLKGPDGTPESGRLAQNFALTGQFLVAQGRAKTAPTAEELGEHIDPSFWEKARSGGCA